MLKDVAKPVSARNVPPRVRTARAMLRGHGEGVTLNVGCGSNLHGFDVLVQNYVGVDCDLNALHHQKATSFMLVCGCAEALPFRDGCASTVICTEVLEHLSDPEEAISEFSRVLDHSGVAVVSVPSLNLPQLLYVGVTHTRAFQSQHHQREYACLRVAECIESISNLLKVFRNNRFKPVKIQSVQPLYFRNRLYQLVSWMEPFLTNLFSHFHIGHYTIFKVMK